MFAPVPSPFLAPEGVVPASLPTGPPPDAPERKQLEARLERSVRKLHDLQRSLYADDRYSLLLVFQALDAAGKDGTIRAVLSGVNPAGCQVTSFKAPSKEELDHDFLWRTAWRLPERGRIGVFNRSYYEEVLVVRVHPGWLGAQRLPRSIAGLGEEAFWTERLESIADHEKHLVRNGTIVLKFWLNVGKDEQARRLLERIDDPSKNWKFNVADVEERTHWDAYQAAFRESIEATHRSYAPWYLIPADDKHFMRATIADIVVRRLESMDLRRPTLDDAARAALAESATRLRAELGE